MKNTGIKSNKLMKDLSSVDTKIDQRPFKQALGDAHTEIHPTPLGSYHLVTALKQRFGANYNNHPEAKKALSHFETEKNRVMLHAKIRTGKING